MRGESARRGPARRRGPTSRGASTVRVRLRRAWRAGPRASCVAPDHAKAPQVAPAHAPHGREARDGARGAPRRAAALPLLPVDAMLATPSSPKPPETVSRRRVRLSSKRGPRRAAVAALLAACALSVAGCPAAAPTPTRRCPSTRRCRPSIRPRRRRPPHRRRPSRTAVRRDAPGAHPAHAARPEFAKARPRS